MIRIYNGQTLDFYLKGEYLTDNTLTYQRDSTSLKYSSCTIMYKENHGILLGDIIYEDTYNIVGIITGLTENGTTTIDLKMSTGSDSLLNEILMVDNSLDGINVTLNNRSKLDVTINTSDQLITNDHNLDLGTLCRQAIRKSPKKESVSFDENGFHVVLEDYTDLNPNTIRYDLPNLSYSLTLDNSGYNSVTIRNKANLSESRTFYLTDDNEVIENDDSMTSKAIVRKVEQVEGEEYPNASDKASSLLKSQTYNNKLVFNFPLNSLEKILNTENIYLSKRIEFILPNEKILSTFVSAFKINKNSFTISCGVTQTRLTEKLGGN